MLYRESRRLADSCGFAAAYEVLAASGHDVHPVLDRPEFGTWLSAATDLVDRDAHRRIACGHVAAHLGRSARFAASAAVRAETDIALTIVLGPQAVLSLASCGLVAVFPRADAGERAWIDVTAGRSSRTAIRPTQSSRRDSSSPTANKRPPHLEAPAPRGRSHEAFASEYHDGGQET